MSRASTVLFALMMLGLAANGCSNVVTLAPGYYPPLSDTGEVQIIDARTMDRMRIERTLSEHYLIARFDVRIPQGDEFESRLSEALERGKQRALSEGGNVLLYTDDSEVIAVIKQDARYAGASGAITMYVMLQRM